MKNKRSKNKETFPSEVEEHFEQMVNTIKILQLSGLVKEYISPKKTSSFDTSKQQYQYQICWENDAPGVNEKNFLSLQAYCIVASQRSYQIVLFDNSLVRCAMSFDSEGFLISQNFAYLPCPIECFTNEDMNIDNIIDSIEVGLLYTDTLLMRTTVRFDYDSTNDNEDHPANHVHLQSPGTRILTDGPICFNKFIKHIIEVFYPFSYFLKKSILKKEQYETLERLGYIEVKRESSSVKKYQLSSKYIL